MQKKIASSLSFVFTAFVLILSLIVFASINGSLAWLANNKQVSADGMSINIKNTVDFEASVNIHGVTNIDKVDGVDKKYTFDHDTHVTTLPLHDPNGISYDEYLKALVLHFEITAGEEDVSVTVDIEASGGISTSNTNFISNAIKFTEATVEGDTPVVVKTNTESAFVTMENNNPTKEYTLSVITSDAPIYVAAGSTVSFYFIIEYNEPFIEYINNYMFTNSISDTEVIYNNDIKFVIGKV